MVTSTIQNPLPTEHTNTNISKILVLESTDAVFKTLESIFPHENYAFQFASSISLATKKFHNFLPDILVVDADILDPAEEINNGLDFLVWAKRSNPNISTILISDKGIPFSLKNSKDIDAVLSKTISAVSNLFNLIAMFHNRRIYSQTSQ